ncbi:probable cytochrome P450 313a2 [Phoenix dactylifera]|uniref:Probable cytochrome P450 313a2 n=1 Tax=Phoenix dactylifera TaxID=42345 RepID=A0A8B7CZQ8_PHODC|nr:probable cytochrome P450 313a2 [Phoenix dactylifera]
MEACDASIPYTLLGFLLQGGGDRPPANFCSSAAPGGQGFLKDYVARGTNALLWISLISVTFLLFRKLARLVGFWAKGSRIPGPPSPSFFGHSKLIAGCGSGANLTGYLSKLHESYGPIVRLWLGPTQLLVSLKDTTLIKDVLVQAEDKLPLTGRAFHLAFGRLSLFVSSFRKVQKRRESLEAYLNGKLAERANMISWKVVECVMGRVDTIMAKGILDCRSVSQHMAFYTLGVGLFGDAFLDWSEAATYEELLLMIAKNGCFWASYRIPPFWRRGYWKYRSLCMRLQCLTQDIIQRSLGQINQDSCKRTSDTGREAGADGTVLLDNTRSRGLFQEEIEEDVISKEEACANMLGLMFHGCLATASLIHSILTWLVLNPELQEKSYSEIVRVWGRTSGPDSLEVQKMHFLLATVYESARLLPAGPLLQRCSLKHDLILNSSITLPAGAMLVVPLQLLQMDDSIWGKDASHFNPHRFLSKAIDHGGTFEEHEKHEECPFISEPNKSAAFLPFGAGARACIGQKFAIHGISALLAYLLQNYEMRLKPDFENNSKPTVHDCLLQLQASPKVVFARRN